MVVSPTAFYKTRRKKLRKELQEVFSFSSADACVIWGGSSDAYSKSMYYLTGATEPSVALVMFGDGRDVLYIPQYAGLRELWEGREMTIDTDPSYVGGCDMEYYGAQTKLLKFPLFADRNTYSNMFDQLSFSLGTSGRLFTLNELSEYSDNVQVLRTKHAMKILSIGSDRVVKMGGIVAQLRAVKDEYEIVCIQKAIRLTKMLLDAMPKWLVAADHERDIIAEIEKFFRLHDTKGAYSPIVASGKNAAVLHYAHYASRIKEQELMLIDVGAEYAGYASDITRVFATDEMTTRQKEIYDIVCAVQEKIAELAKPGMYLRNNNNPELSLQHHTIKLFKKYGLEKYFPHGIGHYLGLDVHDTGSYSIPLEPGNVITIEPGLYLPEESIGVRIEDNYLITNNGATCLSHEISK